MNNIKSIIESYNLHERIYSNNAAKLELANSLTNIFKCIQENKRAELSLFVLKVEKYNRSDLKITSSWYSEHINNTVEHHLSKLFCDVFSIIDYYSYLYERYRKVKILSYPLEQFLLLDLNTVCRTSIREYEGSKAIEDNIVNAVESIFFENKGTLFTTALKITAFLCLFSGELKINPVDFIRYYQSYNKSKHEHRRGNKEPYFNNRWVKGIVEDRIEN